MATMMPPAMVTVPAVVAVPAVVMTAPMNLRRYGLGCLFSGRTSTRIHQRQRLRPIGRRRNRKQSGDRRKTKNHFDIHLHEHFSSHGLGQFQRNMLRLSEVPFCPKSLCIRLGGMT